MSQNPENGQQQPTRKKRPGFGNKKPKKVPQMTRIKTVWITEPSKPFIDDYEVGQQIGEAGQFGKAYRCRRKADKKIFAVKAVSKARFYRLDKSGMQRQALLSAMQGEIDVMRTIKGQNPYIVNLEAVYEDKHMLYIVMEECRGGELFDRIRARGQYTEPDAAKVLFQIGDALKFMHQMHQVVHCDLKPDNILFVSKKPDSIIKIIDFGMAKVLPRLRALTELCGTPYYTAPEIIDGDYAHDADMWSVGVILFVMLFGFPPFYVDPQKYFGQKEAQAIYKLIKKGFTPEVKKGYGPWFPRKMPVTDDARDFISKLMDSDRASRITAKEALQHPWIQNSGVPQKKKGKLARIFDRGNDEKTEIDREIVSEFANFAQSQGFKYAITALFRDQFAQLRPQHFNQLKKLFKKLDVDGNGKISLEEFQNGMLTLSDVNMNEQQIQEMFRSLDVRAGGEIAFDEFLNAAVHDYLVASDQRLYQVFRELDEDEDGKIKMEQIEAKLKELKLYDHVDEMLEILRSTDTNGDGVIDYEEFLHALHPDFNEAPEWFWDVKKGIVGDTADPNSSPNAPTTAADTDEKKDD